LADRFAIEEVSGKHGFRPHIEGLRQRAGFDTLAGLGIVRDADEDPQAALASLQDALASPKCRFTWPVPAAPGIVASGDKNVGILILPGNNQPGALETLCLQSVAGTPAYACVQTYFDCLAQCQPTDPGVRLASGVHLEKNHLQAYLCGKPDSYLHLGKAAARSPSHDDLGYWNWSHEAFVRLIAFLHDLAAAVAVEETP
jgi:hypothetical protein